MSHGKSRWGSVAVLSSRNVLELFHQCQPSVQPPQTIFLARGLTILAMRRQVPFLLTLTWLWVMLFCLKMTCSHSYLNLTLCWWSDNKASELNDLLTDHGTDILLLTETELKEPGDEAQRAEMTPAGYVISSERWTWKWSYMSHKKVFGEALCCKTAIPLDLWNIWGVNRVQQCFTNFILFVLPSSQQTERENRQNVFWTSFQIFFTCSEIVKRLLWWVTLIVTLRTSITANCVN